MNSWNETLAVDATNASQLRLRIPRWLEFRSWVPNVGQRGAEEPRHAELDVGEDRGIADTSLIPPVGKHSKAHELSLEACLGQASHEGAEGLGRQSTLRVVTLRLGLSLSMLAGRHLRVSKLRSPEWRPRGDRVGSRARRIWCLGKPRTPESHLLSRPARNFFAARPLPPAAAALTLCRTAAVAATAGGRA